MKLSSLFLLIVPLFFERIKSEGRRFVENLGGVLVPSKEHFRGYNIPKYGYDISDYEHSIPNNEYDIPDYGHNIPNNGYDIPGNFVVNAPRYHRTSSLAIENAPYAESQSWLDSGNGRHIINVLTTVHLGDTHPNGDENKQIGIPSMQENQLESDGNNDGEMNTVLSRTKQLWAGTEQFLNALKDFWDMVDENGLKPNSSNIQSNQRNRQQHDYDVDDDRDDVDYGLDYDREEDLPDAGSLSRAKHFQTNSGRRPDGAQLKSNKEKLEGGPFWYDTEGPTRNSTNGTSADSE